MVKRIKRKFKSRKKQLLKHREPAGLATLYKNYKKNNWLLTPSSFSIICFPTVDSIAHLQCFTAFAAHRLWALNLHTVKTEHRISFYQIQINFKYIHRAMFDECEKSGYYHELCMMRIHFIWISSWNLECNLMEYSSDLHNELDWERKAAIHQNITFLFGNIQILQLHIKAKIWQRVVCVL